MGEPIHLRTFSIDVGEYHRAAFRKVLPRVALFAALLVVVFSALVVWLMPSAMVLPAFCGLVIVSPLVFYDYWYRLGKELRHPDNARSFAERSAEIVDGVYRASYPSGLSSTIPLETPVRVDYSPPFHMLYMTRSHFAVLPASAFEPGDEVRFRAMLEDRGLWM